MAYPPLSKDHAKERPCVPAVQPRGTEEAYECQRGTPTTIYKNLGVLVFVDDKLHNEYREVYGPGKKCFTEGNIITYTVPRGYSLVLVNRKDKNEIFPMIAGDGWKVSASFNKDVYKIAELGPGKTLATTGTVTGASTVKTSDLQYIDL